MANASRNFGWLRAKQGNLLKDIDICSDVPDTTDHWMQESLKWIFNSGLFWEFGLQKIQAALSMLLLR